MVVRRRRVAPVLAGLCGLALGGCASLEAARLYAGGTRALDRGDSATAVTRLERAAALAPQASEIQNHLGLAYAAAGRDAAALRAFRRAVAIDCDNAAARANLQAAQRRAREGP
jgi:Flp pilus assembly protein TadD